MAKIRTRARAVDMLGRQQIAGTQNAINELFKNAHDAYANHVQIDFFEEEGTLVIRDDGVGMTTEDFEEKTEAPPRGACPQTALLLALAADA